MTILQQRILKTPIFMTILNSELLLNSLSQYGRLCGLAKRVQIPQEVNI